MVVVPSPEQMNVDRRIAIRMARTNNGLEQWLNDLKRMNTTGSVGEAC